MSAPFVVNGLNVDARSIAEGLYGFICDQGEEHIVAFGLIPKWAVDLWEKALREKVIAEGCKRVGVTPEEAKPYLDEPVIQKTVQKISHQISIEIYAAARRAGRLVV